MPSRGLRAALDRQIILILRRLLNFDPSRLVVTWARAVLRIHPRLEETVLVCSEWSELYALLFLLSALLTTEVLNLGFKAAVHRVVDVDVGARAGRSLSRLLLVESWVGRAKCDVDSLFLQNFILDIILLLLMLVVARARSFGESLPRVRRFTLVLPKLATLRLVEE